MARKQKNMQSGCDKYVIEFGVKKIKQLNWASRVVSPQRIETCQWSVFMYRGKGL